MLALPDTERNVKISNGLHNKRAERKIPSFFWIGIWCRWAPVLPPFSDF
jgi:hypothetical protein